MGEVQTIIREKLSTKFQVVLWCSCRPSSTPPPPHLSLYPRNIPLSFQPTHLEIINESYMHAVPKGVTYTSHTHTHTHTHTHSLSLCLSVCLSFFFSSSISLALYLYISSSSSLSLTLFHPLLFTNSCKCAPIRTLFLQSFPILHSLSSMVFAY